LIIINKFFINQLLKESNSVYVNFILNTYNSNLISKYLHRFKIISSNVFRLFNHDKSYEFIYDLYDYFYFNNNNDVFSDDITHFNFDRFLHIIYLISLYGYDINMIEYCSNLFYRFNFKIPSYLTRYNYKFIPNFPLSKLKKYSEKFICQIV